MSTMQNRPRACDSCRKKKVRCNGPDVSSGPCATCTIYSVECTYNDRLKSSGPRSYVQRLEDRIANLERLLREYSSYGDTGDSSSSNFGRTPTNLNGSGGQRTLGPLPAGAYSNPEDVDPLSFLTEEESDSDDEFVSLPETNLGAPGLLPELTEGQTTRFYGKSSLHALAGRAFDEKGEIPPTNHTRTYREEFWTTPDWLAPILTPGPVLFEFPVADLLQHLVECYFENMNMIYPILHRPTFMSSIQRRLHESNQSFGAVVLMVCAIGCRFTDDPRVGQVISPGSSCTPWKFYHQVNSTQKRHYLPHSLYEAILYPLTAIFLEGYSPPDAVWMTVAVGLRIMQDAGVHHKPFSSQKTLEVELWKRSFWVLIILDRTLSTILGRPCALQDEDFDTDLPLMRSDEDLDESSSKPQLQPDSLTQISSFVCMIKLSQILAFTLRTVYSTKRSRLIFGYTGKGWEQRVIATLGSALSRWLDTVPEHLRWGSEASKKDRVFLVQSAILRCQFHEIQIHIHRAFAVRDPPDPELSGPSMNVCKDAAKQCIAIIDSTKDVLLPVLRCFAFLRPLFASIALLSIYSWKTGGVERNSAEHRAIEAGTNLIEVTSERVRSALCLRTLVGIIRGLASGSHDGWTPKVEDLYQLQIKTMMYVDKDGFASSLNGYGKLRARAGAEIVDPPAKTIVPFTRQGEPDAEYNLATDIEPNQPNRFSPIDFLTNSMGFSFAAPASTLAEDEELDRFRDSDRNGQPLVLPMDFMIYNDFMMDIGDTARLFERDFLNSVLLESTPAGGNEDVKHVWQGMEL